MKWHSLSFGLCKIKLEFFRFIVVYGMKSLKLSICFCFLSSPDEFERKQETTKKKNENTFNTSMSYVYILLSNSYIQCCLFACFNSYTHSTNFFLVFPFSKYVARFKALVFIDLVLSKIVFFQTTQRDNTCDIKSKSKFTEQKALKIRILKEKKSVSIFSKFFSVLTKCFPIFVKIFVFCVFYYDLFF